MGHQSERVKRFIEHCDMLSKDNDRHLLAEFTKAAGWFVIIVAAISLVLSGLLNIVEKAECRRWAKNPQEVRHDWQRAQCEHHGIDLHPRY